MNPTIRLPEREKISKRASDFAMALSRIHGSVKAVRERGGLHFYIASPACLDRDGVIELEKMHLAINVDKYLGEGKYARGNISARKFNPRTACMCMKTETVYRIDQLLQMPTLEQRGYDMDQIHVQTDVWNYDKCINQHGILIPEAPGDLTPLLQLPADHPARWYLETQRGYNLLKLTWQFQVAYCTKEYGQRPDDRPKFYAPGSFGFRNTPQGRVVFQGLIYGARASWQARILEFDTEIEGVRHRACWHPYQNEWTVVQKWGLKQNQKTGEFKEAWVDLPDPYNAKLGFDNAISKYRNADGTGIRNQTLLGFDAAIEFNSLRPGRPRVALIAEGPLDAGRFGPPGMCVMGKFLSDTQLRLLQAHFDILLLARQNDEVGKSVGEEFVQSCKQIGRQGYVLVPPAHVKDFGSISDAEAKTYLDPYLEM